MKKLFFIALLITPTVQVACVDHCNKFETKTEKTEKIIKNLLYYIKNLQTIGQKAQENGTLEKILKTIITLESEAEKTLSLLKSRLKQLPLLNIIQKNHSNSRMCIHFDFTEPYPLPRSNPHSIKLDCLRFYVFNKNDPSVRNIRPWGVCPDCDRTIKKWINPHAKKYIQLEAILLQFKYARQEFSKNILC